MLLADLGVDLKIGTWRVTIETGLDERAKPIASALGLGYMLIRGEWIIKRSRLDPVKGKRRVQTIYEVVAGLVTP